MDRTRPHGPGPNGRAQGRPSREPWLILPRPTPAVVVLGIALLSTLGTVSVGQSWAASSQTPRVTLLGSGSRLSVLVSTDGARLLIASGDDPGAFGRALTEARRPTLPRLDLLLIAGDGRDLPVATAAAAASGARRVLSLAPIAASVAADVPALARASVLIGPSRIRLGDGVTVTFEVAPGETGRVPTDRALDWRATVAHAESRIVILSDGSAAGRFPPAGPVSVVVVAGDAPAGATVGGMPPALVVNAEAATGKELRQEIVPLGAVGVWLVRVFPGDAVGLDLVRTGIRLPPTASRFPTPPSGDGRSDSAARGAPRGAPTGYAPVHSRPSPHAVSRGRASSGVLR